MAVPSVQDLIADVVRGRLVAMPRGVMAAAAGGRKGLRGGRKGLSRPGY